MMWRLKFILFLGIVVLVLIIIALVLAVFGNFFGSPTTKIDLSRPSVVKQIDSLGRLETASFSIEKIIEAGDEGNTFQNILFGDKLLLVADGKVIAGVDLMSVTEKDVNVQGDGLTINVPGPTIFSSNLDSSKTKVYDRKLGLLNRGDKDLESKARTAAEGSIRQAACEDGILDEARKNAIERITQLFKFAGFTTVNVNIPQGSC